MKKLLIICSVVASVALISLSFGSSSVVNKSNSSYDQPTTQPTGGGFVVEKVAR